MSQQPGTLFIVSTPIGNLRDISLRALDVLKQVGIVAAEDTRHTRKLLSAYEIRTSLFSLHAQSSESKLDSLIKKISEGQSVAYVTDAGSPAISDPGSALVDKAAQASIPINVIPGPSAVTAALALSGFSSGDFRFLGFLSRSRGKRRAELADAFKATSSLVLFESPSRVRSLLEILADLAPKRRVAACRELTKIHEEVIRGTPDQLLDQLPEKPLGEFTLVIEDGPPLAETNDQHTDLAISEKAHELISQDIPTKKAAKELVREFGISRKKAYDLIVKLKD